MDSVLKVEYKMNINKSKMRIMVCSRIKSGDAEGIRLGNETLKVVKQFCYLGSKITDDDGSREDIKCRLAVARKAFLKKRNLLTSSLDLSVRKSFLKVFVWSVAMYGSETWTINSLDQKRIEAFEVWCCRRMLKIRWVDHIINKEVLNRIGEKRNLWHNLTRRGDWLAGHVLRHQGITNLVLEGSVEGKNHRGRPRDEYTEQIQKDVGCSMFLEMKELAQDRVAWRAARNQSVLKTKTTVLIQ
ncbi:uncharacterized protein LOC126267466 [Schistocerca gregaria]|uniref:uncharacterized protein LOC126267466 n=1 Tax=Schistocerca gregaria TaxID=7010 RepID=UPI00211F3D8C|nr:uncharacterized protein LOC126267466 [Schistocerca gregaria]